MDILTHTLSGITAATAIAAFSNRSLWKKSLLIACGAAGAILPDIDAITRWPGFDAVIGSTLGLSQGGGSIYYGNHWYSHHNFTHSLAAGAIFTLLGALLWYLGHRWSPIARSPANFIQDKKGFFSAFFMGYTLHLLGDLPTPGSIWHGIKLFWPLATPVGGFGHIWWWNNYDIFLLLLAGSLAGTSLVFLNHFLKMRSLRYLPAMLGLVIFSATLYQIAHRPIRFSGPGSSFSHAENERQSLAIQKTILGEKLYGIIGAMDRHLKIPF